MATISFDIPAGQVARVTDAIAARNGYNPATDGTKSEFAKKWLIRKAMEEVRSHEANTAFAAAVAVVDSQITIT